MIDLIKEFIDCIIKFWIPAYLFSFLLLIVIMCVTYLFNYIFEVIL